MRLVTIVLVLLLSLIQYPLWVGGGGILGVSEISRELDAARARNDESTRRNARLASEVGNLGKETDAAEERARYDLGMLKKDEIFIQIIDASKLSRQNSSAAAGKSAEKSP
ncbi:MAG: cell division protein FtsB [Burkholderiaceae bacterium]|nr:cell division protein FtsB [Burkholderiaceae bacterium]